MERPGASQLRYTTNYFIHQNPPNTQRDALILSYSSEDGLLGSAQIPEPTANPVIEIITNVDTISSGSVDRFGERTSPLLQNVTITNTPKKSMIVRSEILVRCIRDVVKFYPSQNFTEKSIIVEEPYAVLMHNLSEFEELKSKLEKDSTNSEQAVESLELEHLTVLLDFVRPQYEALCLPVQKRLQETQPTIKFDDIWFLFKPGTIAYAKWDNEWLGCSIERVEKSSSMRSGWKNDSWAVHICFLQMSGVDGEIGCISTTISIKHFCGDKPITSLPVFPRNFYDEGDTGARRDRFEKRGKKVARMLWEGPRHLSYDGECLDSTRRHYEGQLVVDGPHGVEALYLPHVWAFEDWEPFITVEQRTVLRIQGDAFDSPNGEPGLEALTEDHFFIISPYLSAFALSSQSWLSVHAEKVRGLNIPENIPEPLLQPDKLRVLNATIDSHLSNRQILPLDLTGYRSKGLNILLNGPVGVGKSKTVEFTCLRVRRPLLVLTRENLEAGAQETSKFHENVRSWITLAENWGAILCVSSEDKYSYFKPFRHIHLMRECFSGIVFIVTRTLEPVDNDLSSIHLIVQFDALDRIRRKSIWDNLQQNLKTGKGHKVRLSDSAVTLLNHSEIHELVWNGHTITQCFATAIALAELGTNRNMHGEGREEIVVDAEHFKDALNATDTKLYESDDDRSARRRYPLLTGKQEDTPAYKEPTKIKLWPITSDTDINLCIPQLNHVEWEDFKAAASSDLFRKTQFHAIDVLMKDPTIKFDAGLKMKRRREPLIGKRIGGKAVEHLNTDGGDDSSALPTGQAPLPERIRINSPTILKVFQEINDEGSLDPNSSILFFRPYRSLVYSEHDFRDWVARQEIKIQSYNHPKAQHDEHGMKASVNDANDGENMDMNLEKAALENVRCLLKFVDKYIKPKQDFIKSAHCQSIAFADLWYLFRPGDTVINRENGQAYRVVEVRSTRHRVRKPNKETPNFWRTDSVAEFEDNPIFIHYVHVDFNGLVLGPVNTLLSISHFVGMKPIRALPVYPIRFASDPELGKKLVARGKLFVNVARVRHMHYSGLTLQANDEVDSQVVVDFEEALLRNPVWLPMIRSVFGVNMTEMIKDATIEPESVRITRKQNEEENQEQEPTGWCVKECCEDEVTHDDEYVEARLRDEHISSQMNTLTTNTTPSVANVPRALRQISDEDNMSDDDYMIMSYRVFGFVLRNRKWAHLDLKNLTEVPVLGGDKGFDQLVLPPGHKDMVKSMIRQHFRDKGSMQDDKDHTDVVRGKGKGLIMLLHGVPGVGKTSTAECVADSFRRPLFQITSGDLGTTAKEVEEALETNFALANRWKCILLIDEADVFLAERTKEDFARNSLVAVFLRIMEYYAGVLFLTTNRVGVFDEAFTSRIHISLYYPPLERDPTYKVFQKNMERIETRYATNARPLQIKKSDITKFALDYYDNNKQGRWNGRQIRNAFQSAIALAELDARGTDDVVNEPDQNPLVILRAEHFEVVAEAYKGFTDYLNQTYGVDFARRARENLWRSDTFGTAKVPNALTTRLKVADPRPVSDPWPQANYAGYSFNGGVSQPMYHPPGAYPAHSYQTPDPTYRPGPMASQSRVPEERVSNPGAYPDHLDNIPRLTERYAGGPQSESHS